MDFDTWVDTHFANSSVDLDILRKAYEAALNGAPAYEEKIRDLEQVIDDLRHELQKHN